MTAGTPWLPAAVLAVCEPWLSSSRGDRDSAGSLSPLSLYQRAPITLLLHDTGLVCPGSHTPWNLPAITPASGRGSDSAAKLGLSGQKPVSMTPTTTPRPALRSLPNCFCQAPPLPSRPRNFGVEMVSSGRTSFFHTLTTPGVLASLAACTPVSCAPKPLRATVRS